MRRALARCTITATTGLGLGVALALPAAAGGGFCHGPGTTGTDAAVEMADLCFRDTVVHVAPGTEVTWTNEDQVPHVVAGTGWGDFQEVAPEGTTSHRFAEEGVFPYTCYLHPSMNGAVVVGTADTPLATTPVAAVDEADDGGGSSLGIGALGAAAGLLVGVVATRVRLRRP